VWAWDFVHDRTEDGRPLKWPSIVDEYTRECLALEVGRSFKSGDVIDVLKELILIRGTPGHIRSDNGPEFIAQAIVVWLGHARGVYAVHQARQSVGERLRREFPRARAG
jgi:putative transposase